MKHDEEREQVSYFQWVRLWQDRPGCAALRWVYHTPNGGKRPTATAGRMKALGASRGVPDVLCPIQAPGREDRGDGDWWYGLAAEFKSPTGRLSPEQRDWLAHFEGQGWCVRTWRDWPTAARDTAAYLGLPDETVGGL